MTTATTTTTIRKLSEQDIKGGAWVYSSEAGTVKITGIGTRTGSGCWITLDGVGERFSSNLSIVQLGEEPADRRERNPQAEAYGY